MKQILFILIQMCALLLVVACAGASVTPDEASVTQQILGETATPLDNAPDDHRDDSGLAISMLSQTSEQIAWQTKGGERKSLSMLEFEKAFPATFNPGLSRITSAGVSPSGQTIAFIVAPVVGGLTLDGWHIAVVNMEDGVLGLYSADPPRCWIVDFVWRSDEEGIVVQLPGCGLVLIAEDAKVLFDVDIEVSVRGLLVSPNSQWAALDDGPGDQLHPRVDRRIEFISLEDPDIRLDLPAAGIVDWLDREWVKRPWQLDNS